MRLSRRTTLVITGILIVVGFRFVLFINPMINPDRGITVDSEQYLSLASSILHDRRYESTLSPEVDLFRAPGYPAFLAMILGITGESLTAVLFIQFVLGLGCAAILYLLGKQILHENLGLLGSVIFLLSPNSLFWSATIMTEILFSVGMLLSLYLIWKSMKDQFPLWQIGILLGVLTLIRPIGLYLILLWAVWLFIGRLLKLVSMPTIQKIAIFLLVGLIVVAPWFVRNQLKHGELTLSTVSATTINTFHIALSLVEAEGIEWEDAKLEVFEMNEEGSALLYTIKTYPLAFVKVQVRGIMRTVLGTEVGTWMKLLSGQSYDGSGILNAFLSGSLAEMKDSIVNIFRSNLPGANLLLIWGILYTLAISILSIIGFIRLFRVENMDLRYFGVLILITMVYLILTPGAAGEARFRVPVEPMFAFLSAMSFYIKPVSTESGGDS